jgi:RHS repeat-associated protein
LNLFEPTISDFRGNVLGVVTNSAVVWNPSRPTGFGAVPGYQPVALGNGADIVVSSAWRGRWADISGYYNIGLRPYDPISGRWLTYDSVWNEIDPSGMTFCGGDPVNSVDSDGRLAANGPDNGVQNLNFGTMAVMGTYLQTTTYFNDGSALITGYYSENPSLYDPSQVAGWSYTTIRTDTGLSQFFVSESPLPSDYSQTTWTPITTWDYEQQQETEGAKFMLTGVAMLATGTEEFAPEIFGTEATVGEGTVIAEGTAGGNLLTQGSLITDSSRLLPGVSGSPSDIVVLGRQVDTAVAANWPGYQTLNIQNWTIPQNDAFIQAAINQRQTFYLASPVNYQTLWNPNFNGMTVFGRELGQIYQAGYQQVGLLLVPPPLP